MAQTLALAGALRRLELGLLQGEAAVGNEARVYEEARASLQQQIWNEVYWAPEPPPGAPARCSLLIDPEFPRSGGTCVLLAGHSGPCRSAHAVATAALREAWATPAMQWLSAMGDFLQAQSFALSEISCGRVPPATQEERLAAHRQQELRAEELGYDD